MIGVLIMFIGFFVTNSMYVFNTVSMTIVNSECI